MFVGVDGCAQGWVAVATRRGRFAEARLLPDFDAVVAAYARARTIGVDIPVGLTDEAARRCDRAARRFLEGQASSVFNAPVRSVLEASSYEEANRISLEVCGKGLSRQSYNLVAKIREVDRHTADPRLHEVHPEVAFRIMSGGRAVGRKTTWGGLQARLGLLRAEGIEIPSALGDVDRVGIDDVVDAAAVAWTASRIAKNTARSFPDDPDLHPTTGRALAIWG